MNADDYQKLAGRTLLDEPGFEIPIDHWQGLFDVLAKATHEGLRVEAIKKIMFHRHPGRAEEGDGYLYDELIPQTPLETMILWNVAGLVGETSELAMYIALQLGIDPEVVKKELGDILWYVSAIATKFDLSLTDIMQANIEKLEKRFPGGFTPEDSMSRVDVTNE